MDLRETQQPLKDRYRADPATAKITLRATGSRADAPVACSVDLGRAIYEAQAHEGVGGAGTTACSGDLLVAAAMGIEATRIEVFVEGDLDLRGTLGLTRDVSAGFAAIRVRFEIDAPTATADELASLQTKTERYCTVLQTLTKPPQLKTEFCRA
jgi:uncharacterized OsmC-like protein